jgi:hypothetical protein
VIALLSLVVAVIIARCAQQFRTVVAVQVPAFLVGCAALIGTAPNHGSTYTTGILLSLALAPLTVLLVAAGRRWRTHSTATAV